MGRVAVNVIGSFVIGFAAVTLSADARFPSSDPVRQFLMVGVCGGYTTFSAFSLQTLTLIEGGQWLPAAANAGLSMSLCIGAVWLQYTAGLFINPR